MDEHSVLGRTIREITSNLKERNTSASEITQSHIDQIKKVNGSLNAVVQMTETEALEQAENLDIDYVFERVFDELALRRNLIYNQLIDEVLTQYGCRKFMRQTLEYHSDILSKELAASIMTLLAAGSLKTLKEINFYDSILKRGR